MEDKGSVYVGRPEFGEQRLLTSARYEFYRAMNSLKALIHIGEVTVEDVVQDLREAGL